MLSEPRHAPPDAEQPKKQAEREADYATAAELKYGTLKELTDRMTEQENGPQLDAGARLQVQPWSLVLLRRMATA